MLKIMLFGICGLMLFVVLGNLFFVMLSPLTLAESMPWTSLQYALKHHEKAPVVKLLVQAHGISGLLSLMILGLIFAPRKKSLHGDATWATPLDMKKANPSILAEKGILLGLYKGKPLLQGDQGFVLLAAGTRQGKGISTVITNCLNWHDSLVVTDIKMENFRITSGYRAYCGQDVYLFSLSPGDHKTHRWNPLDYVSRDPHQRISDAQRIATLLIANSSDPMWSSDAQELFTGVILMIMDNDHLPFTLGEIYRQMRPEMAFDEYFTEILECKGSTICNSPTARAILAKYVSMADKQRTGVLSTLSPILNLFANPVLDAATSASDFDFRTLRKKRQTLYIGVSPNDLETFQPIIRLFYQQLVSENTRSLPSDDDPYEVLLLMDEFPALGKMNSFVTAMSLMAGYNLRVLAIIQSEAQLRGLYKEQADTILENVQTRLYFAAKNHKNAQQIAAELGDTTTTTLSKSKQKGIFTKPGSESQSVAKRGLLLAQEVKTIGTDAVLIITDNCPPVLAKKAVYFKMPAFLARCVMPENIRLARKTTSQRAFISLVRPTPEIPKLAIISHTIRGENPEFDPDPHKILPAEGVNIDNVEQVAQDYFDSLIGENNE